MTLVEDLKWRTHKRYFKSRIRRKLNKGGLTFYRQTQQQIACM
ncbi:MAG: hypothetical protein ACLS9A_06560 [Clostridia bacterium]